MVALVLPVLAAVLLGVEESASRLDPLDPQAFDRAAAAHLLSRAGFGGTLKEIDELAALGLEKAVDHVLDFSDPDPLEPFAPTYTDRPSRPELAGLKPEERKKAVRSNRQADAEQFQRLRAWWLRRMVLSPRPLEEKMTLFWHSHFATSQREVKNSYHLYLQNRTLRAHASGSFKELTRAVARDPAMLEYLDNNQNNRRAPNENFARELLELFTLGIGNYTEKDIKEAARALTGWTFRGNEFVFNERAHDPGEKTFLGRSGRFTGDDIIEIIFEQPAASRFISRKLFAFFAHPDPPPEMIEALSRTLRQSRFEVRPVLAQLFKSAEFYSSRSRGTQIKSPLRLLVGTLRLLGLDPGESPAFPSLAAQMGQDLFLPPNVKGWEEGQAWISTSTLFDRYNVSRPILGLGGPGGGPFGERRAFRPFQRRNLPSWDPASGARELLGEGHEGLSTAEAVDRVLQRFLLVPISEEGRRKLVEFYSATDPRVRLVELIHLVLSAPEYQLG